MNTNQIGTMKLEGIDAIIFDLGGTLYEPASDICGLTREFMSDIGYERIEGFTDEHIKEALVDANEWLWNYMVENNVPVNWEPSVTEWLQYDRELFRGLGITENVMELAEKYQKKWDEFFEDVNPVLIEGVREVLVELQQRGFALGIASNRYSNPIHILQKDEIYEMFGSVEWTGVPGYTKPSPYMLLKVAEDLGINPRRCVYVGNIFSMDCIAAQRAEMVPILLTWVDPHEVHKITTDVVVIEHIDDLLEILG